MLVTISAIAMLFGGPHYSAATHRSVTVWRANRQASYYGYGGRTACGRSMVRGAVWVAALKSNLAHCGMKVTICHGTRCSHVTVQDRGAWRSDRRDWDMTPDLKRLLRCSDLCTVKWRYRW